MSQQIRHEQGRNSLTYTALQKRHDAICNLAGGSISFREDISVDPPVWNVTYKDGQTPPTESEIDDEVALIESLQYQQDRKLEYPSLDDVIVALAEKTEGDSTMWDKITAERAEVKVKFPKPKE